MEQIQRIQVKNIPIEFKDWYNSLLQDGYSIETVVNNGYINYIYVEWVDTGDWSDIKFGRVRASAEIAFCQKVYRPALINGKFIVNYDVQQNAKE